MSSPPFRSIKNLPSSRDEVRSWLPYGNAFLFVDEVLSLEPGRAIETSCWYSSENPLVRAHLNLGPPIIPGVLQIEQVCQSAMLMAVLSGLSASPGKTLVLGESRMKFRAIAPADAALRARVSLEAMALDVLTITAEVSREEVCTATGRATFAWVNVETMKPRPLT